MICRSTLIGAVTLLALGQTALANGRAPATMSVHSRTGHPNEIYSGTTFGLLISRDDGCSFRWVCEQNIGYAGAFDPKYAIDADGTIFATTYQGLRISRDQGCSFVTATEAAPPGPGRIAGLWVDAIAVPASGHVWVATADSAHANDIYKSTDHGETFVPMGLPSAVVWYKSISVARPDEQRVWVTGYQVAGAPQPAAHLYRSDNGGTTWTETPLPGVVMAATPTVLLEAVEPTLGDLLFLRSVAANPGGGDILYRSPDGGTTWTEVLRTSDAMRSVVIRDVTTVLVASAGTGLHRSTDGGQTFTAVANTPKTNCLAERDDHQLLTCATNWDPDFLALGRSTDGAQWQKIFRFVELAGPVQCPAGTPQHDTCDALMWPSLREQFGVTGPRCGAVVDGAPLDAPQPDTTVPQKGCCDAGSHQAAPWLLALLTLGILSRRRRTA